MKMMGLLSSREKRGLSPAEVVHVKVTGPPLVQLVGVERDNADTKGTRTESKLGIQTRHFSTQYPTVTVTANLMRKSILKNR